MSPKASRRPPAARCVKTPILLPIAAKRRRGVLTLPASYRAGPWSTRRGRRSSPRAQSRRSSPNRPCEWCSPAWRAFNRDAAATGDVGIFHETYVVPADRVESLYGNMTEFGLAAAFGSVERGRGRGRTAAHERLESTEPDYVDASA